MGLTLCLPAVESGEVYVWGYGLLGKGPKVQQLRTPEVLPMALFGKNEYSTEVGVMKIRCGINYFAALTSESCTLRKILRIKLLVLLRML